MPEPAHNEQHTPSAPSKSERGSCKRRPLKSLGGQVGRTHRGLRSPFQTDALAGRSCQQLANARTALAGNPGRRKMLAGSIVGVNDQQNVTNAPKKKNHHEEPSIESPQRSRQNRGSLPQTGKSRQPVALVPQSPKCLAACDRIPRWRSSPFRYFGLVSDFGPRTSDLPPCRAVHAARADGQL